MRIGIDGGCLANRRGFGRFAREIIQALSETDSAHEFVVFVDRPSSEQVSVPKSMESVIVDVKVAPSVGASAAGRRSLSDMLAMGRAVARSRLDAVYFPASYSFFPVWNVARVVVTMHDTLALAHPEWVFPGGRGKLAWRVKEQSAAFWADRIVTVSQAARRDLCIWFRLPEGRIHVVTEGPDLAFGPTGNEVEADTSLTRHGLEPDGNFLLYVGGLSPHKNLVRLISAFHQAGVAERGTKLMIVGDFSDVFHTEVPELQEQVQKLNLQDAVLFTGYVADAELAHFYRRAYALVQPSLMEGFGLPAVEAMVSGTPVLTSTAGSLPEIVGEAGAYFNPTDVTQMAKAIRDLVADPAERSRLAGLALLQASQFTWTRAARLLIDCFDELSRQTPKKFRHWRVRESGSAPRGDGVVRAYSD